MLLKAVAAATLVLVADVSVVASPPQLHVDTPQSDTGTFSLSWEADGENVVLQEATREDFVDARVLYEGPDRATVVSGRTDGVYHYRVRRPGEHWSAPVHVVVAHHSLKRAAAFLSVGAIVFLATATLIVDGHRRHRRDVKAAQ